MADNPVTQAAKENVAYTGESGARDTRKTELWNKSPADVDLIKPAKDIANRAAYIANNQYSVAREARKKAGA
jgi:hypothetical protein